MRIALVSPYSWTYPGGVTRHVGALAEHLIAAGHDARILAPPEQTPALENELHNAMQKSLPELRNKRFTIAKIDPVRDEQGTVIAYQVEIH